MIYPYTFDNQFEKYIGQFMRVFGGFQTQDGVVRDGSNPPRRVPIVYGNMSRVVSSVLNNRDSFNSNMVPMMAVNMEGIEMDTNRKKPTSHIDSVAIERDGAKTGLTRLIGPPFIMSMSVAIYASSTTELFSILEQILLIFNPRIAIQVDNKSVNSDYITEITLKSIQPDFQYPMGINKELVMLSLNFEVPVRLRYPYGVDGGVVEQIVLNIFDESSDGIQTPLSSMVINGDDMMAGGSNVDTSTTD